MPLLVKELNESAVTAFGQDQAETAAECLKKAEKLLEVCLLIQNKINL